MIIESLIRRKDGTTVTVGSKTYFFTAPPGNPDGPHTCEVTDPLHIKVLLRASDGFAQAGTAPNRRKIAEANAEAALAARMQEVERKETGLHQDDDAIIEEEDGLESFDEVIDGGGLIEKPKFADNDDMQLVAFLDRSVHRVVQDIELLSLGPDELGLLKEAETQNKQRKGVFAAIEKKLAEKE